MSQSASVACAREWRQCCVLEYGDQVCARDVGLWSTDPSATPTRTHRETNSVSRWVGDRRVTWFVFASNSDIDRAVDATGPDTTPGQSVRPSLGVYFLLTHPVLCLSLRTRNCEPNAAAVVYCVAAPDQGVPRLAICNGRLSDLCEEAWEASAGCPELVLFFLL